MAIHQCHEQNNAIGKGSSGGANGITNNPSALRRWMVAGPEVARIIMAFKDQSRVNTSTDGTETGSPHDARPAVQVEFMKDVRAMKAVIKLLGNPFMENSEDLMVLDTTDVMDVAITDTVRRIEALGREQYEMFVSEILEQCTNINNRYTIQKQNATVHPTTNRDTIRNLNFLILRVIGNSSQDCIYHARHLMVILVNYLPTRTMQLLQPCQREARLDQYQIRFTA